MSIQTQAALELRCPDHPGHILTRSGYCIKADHMPTKPGIPVSRAVWSVPTEPKLESEVDVIATTPDTATTPLRFGPEADMATYRHMKATEQKVAEQLDPDTGGADETTISFSSPGRPATEPMALSEFDRRVDALTGELHEPAQMTLGAMFKQYEAPNVRVNCSGGHVLSLETLRDMTEGKPLIPGMAVECTFSGYICGAGLKWRKGGEGKEANLNINLDDLLILRVMGETIEEEDPEKDWEDGDDD